MYTLSAHLRRKILEDYFLIPSKSKKKAYSKATNFKLSNLPLS